MLPPVFATLRASSAVLALLGTPPRVYRHGDAPQDVPRPYVTWSLISGLPENNLSDPPPVDHLVIQVDCWSQTDEQVEQLAIAVRDAIEPYAHMTGFPVNERERDTKLYRISLQFDWWLSRP